MSPAERRAVCAEHVPRAVQIPSVQRQPHRRRLGLQSSAVLVARFKLRCGLPLKVTQHICFLSATKGGGQLR